MLRSDPARARAAEATAQLADTTHAAPLAPVAGTQSDWRVALVAVAALGILAIAGACGRPAATEEPPADAPISVHVQPVVLDTLKASITLTGAIAPSPGGDMTITAPEAGKIAELPKAEGDAVQPGDLLVRFEIPSIDGEVMAAQSAMTQAATRLQTARAEVARLTGLVQRGIVPQQNLDTAAREQQEAEAEARRAESAKAAADLLASHAVVRARFAGVVARRFHNPGEMVEPGTADPVLRVIDPRRLEVVASAPVSAASLIVPGRPVTVFNPLDGSTIAGTVLNRPAVPDGATAVDVRVSLGAAAPALAPGSPIQIEITGEERAGVLVVPSAALRREDNVTFVFVAGEDGRAHRKAVTVGVGTAQKSQVLSGLTAGDQVITDGGSAVQDGVAISIVR